MELVDDVFYHMCSFLSINDLLHLEQTCKSLKKKIRSHQWDIHLANTHVYYNKLTKYHRIKTTKLLDLLNLTDDIILVWKLKENESKYEYCKGLLHYTRKWAYRNNCYTLVGIYEYFPILYQFHCGCIISSDEYGYNYSSKYYLYDIYTDYCEYCNKLLKGDSFPNIIFITTQAKYFLKKYKTFTDIPGKGETTRKYFESTKRKMYSCSINQIKPHISKICQYR